MGKISHDSRHSCLTPKFKRNAAEIGLCEYACCGLLMDNLRHVQKVSFQPQTGKVYHE